MGIHLTMAQNSTSNSTSDRAHLAELVEMRLDPAMGLLGVLFA